MVGRLKAVKFVEHKMELQMLLELLFLDELSRVDAAAFVREPEKTIEEFFTREGVDILKQLSSDALEEGKRFARTLGGEQPERGA